MREHVTDRAEAFYGERCNSDERQAIEDHLAVCIACREAFTASRVALDALRFSRPETALDARFEQRVIAAVRRGRTANLVARAVASVIFAAVCLGAGFLAGRGSNRPTTVAIAADTSLHEFLMLLEEESWPPAAPLARDGYSAWVRDLASMNRFVGAEKLTEERGVRIASNGEARPAEQMTATNYSGWYLVRARDYAEAVALARRGPHLAYGTILVRQVE